MALLSKARHSELPYNNVFSLLLTFLGSVCTIFPHSYSYNFTCSVPLSGILHCNTYTFAVSWEFCDASCSLVVDIPQLKLILIFCSLLLSVLWYYPSAIFFLCCVSTMAWTCYCSHNVRGGYVFTSIWLDISLDFCIFNFQSELFLLTTFSFPIFTLPVPLLFSLVAFLLILASWVVTGGWFGQPFVGGTGGGGVRAARVPAPPTSASWATGECLWLSLTLPSSHLLTKTIDKVSFPLNITHPFSVSSPITNHTKLFPVHLIESVFICLSISLPLHFFIHLQTSSLFLSVL